MALALADSGADIAEALDDWEHVFVYYAAIRSDRGGRVIAVPGMPSPLVTYRLTDSDLSRLARGLVHLGEALLAAGATELYPSIEGGDVVRRPEDLVRLVGRRRPGPHQPHDRAPHVQHPHEQRPREGRHRQLRRGCGTCANLRVNDASLLADAPGVNPQAAIMTIALRNAEHFLATTLNPGAR